MPVVRTELWFDTEALEAAEFWTSLVPGSRIVEVVRDRGGNPHTQEGAVLHVSFELNGQRFGAVNGGPHFPLTEAVSISLTCDDQAEADRYWEELTRGGTESMCGWCRDRYGMSWQIVPREFTQLQSDPDPAVARRSTQAMLAMHRLDIDVIRRIARGTETQDRMPQPAPEQGPVPHHIEGAVRVPAPAQDVWALVSRPDWWVDDGVIRDHEIVSDGARHTVTDPAHGAFALTVEDSREGEYIALRREGRQDADDPRTLTQFWVDPLEDGTTMVRLLESGFRDGGATDDERRPAHDDQAEGWRIELEALRGHFAAG
ncbi:VOC family protein [Kocuria palustris]|uniref:VOC family protein n=1 Tax=Kocuria palustris TaxID=71999 RepID=UPI0011AA9757|nr:VOC family protein [Kocuria palustris]